MAFATYCDETKNRTIQIIHQTIETRKEIFITELLEIVNNSYKRKHRRARLTRKQLSQIIKRFSYIGKKRVRHPLYRRRQITIYYLKEK